MAAGVEELIGQLYEMIQDAWAVPLSSEKCVIDRDKALDLLDGINAQLPNDIKQAKNIVENRNQILDDAQKEGEAIRLHAEEQAKQMVSDREIIAAAKKKAAEMITVADTKSKELRRAANEYVDESLKDTEEALAKALNEVKQSRARLRSAASSGKTEIKND